MHYIGILCVLVLLAFATGGHSQAFGRAAEAATKGDVAEAIDLFSTALRRTLQDADVAQRRAEAQALAQAQAQAQAEVRYARVQHYTR